MTESFISLCCANSYWTNAGCYVSNTAITLSQAQTDKTSTRHDGPLCWLVLGKQPQWGYIESLSGTRDLNLPLAYVNRHLCVVATGGNTKGYGAIRAQTISLTQVRLYAYTPEDGAYSHYLSLGYQLQWGFTLFEPVDYKNINFTLPLAVNGTFCAFSTGYDAKGSTFLWHSMSHFNNINVGVTGFVFDSRYTFTGLGYLAICWQKQWGKSTSTGEYVTHTFPIKFTVIPIVVAGALTSNTSGNTGSQSNPCYRSITVSNFVFCMYDNARGYAGSTYIAIGYQLQWGKILGDTVNLKIITFPVPFNESFGGVALFNGDPVAAAEYATITDVTNTNFKIYMYANNAGTGYANANIFYLFLGAQQQWGFTGRNIKTWVYPIQFNNVFGVVGTWNRSSGAIYESITIDKITNISCGIDGAWSGGSSVKYECLTIAIGLQQQWGYVKSTKVTFPIQFNIIYTVLGNAHGSNNSNNDHYFLGSFSTTEASFYYSNMNFTGLSWIAIGSA